MQITSVIFQPWRMKITEMGALQKPAPYDLRVLKLKLTILELEVEVLNIRRMP